MFDTSLFLRDVLSSSAYIDGGTGSMILQASLAGILTAGYVVKTRWEFLKVSAGELVRKVRNRAS